MGPPGPLLVQAVAFVVAGLTGIACGLALDGYRVLRRVLGPPRRVGHLLDVLFVAAVFPVVATGLLLTGWGELRAYSVGGLLVGGGLYLALGSPVVLPAGTAVLTACARALSGAARAAGWPARALERAVSGAARRLRAAGGRARRSRRAS
jgi:hypothetical protein